MQVVYFSCKEHTVLSQNTVKKNLDFVIRQTRPWIIFLSPVNSFSLEQLWNLCPFLQLQFGLVIFLLHRIVRKKMTVHVNYLLAVLHNKTTHEDFYLPYLYYRWHGNHVETLVFYTMWTTRFSVSWTRH